MESARVLSAKRCGGAGSADGGFTLIELLVVTAIIGILSVLLFANLRHALKKAREGQTLANLNTLRTALKMSCVAANGTWPGTITDAPAATPGNDTWGDQVNADFSKYIGPMLPQATVGNLPFDDGSSSFSRGVYQTTNTSGNPGGNYRGWFYSNQDGRLMINNSLESTEGTNYSEY